MSADSCDAPAKAAANRDKGPMAVAVEAWAISVGFKCIVCNDTKEDWRSLWKHMQTHDPVPNDDQVAKDNSTGLVECLVCGHQTRYMRDIIRHFATHSTSRGFQCNKCPKSYTSTNSLLTHLIESHEEEGSTVYKCEKCDYSAHLRQSVRIHMKVAHAGWARCEVCFKTMSARWLLQHYYIHTGEKRFSCNVCGKKFNFRHLLVYHLKSKHLKVTHDCNVCGKSFTNQCSLVAHVRKAHTKEPSHFCCICSEPCYSHSEYVRHVGKVHTMEKNHKCGVCGKAFFSKVHLQIHSVVHTGEKPFSCDVCGKAFAFKTKVKVHMRTHSEERPFKCDHCGRAFKWKHNLADHVHAKHT